jgi:gephyrin
VTQISHASPSTLQPLRPGQIARITTGAPLPKGADAVVMVEDTVVVTETFTGEEHTVNLLASVPSGENVREIGSDVQRGSIILRKGDEVTFAGGEVGLLASVGVSHVRVYAKPIVGVLSTGNELVDYTEKRELRLGEVRDSNRPGLLTTLKSWGYEAMDLGIASDTYTPFYLNAYKSPGALETALRNGLDKVDVIITTGGVSMGELDLLKPTIERSLNGTIHFGRVAMKPGKPTTFGTIPSPLRGTKLIFALPGNPASALVTFHLFVLPSLRKASGLAIPELPVAKVTLAQDVKLDPRPEYHRVFIAASETGGLVAISTGGQRSSRVGSLRGANGLLCLPSSKVVGREIMNKGELIDALVLGRLG